MLRSGIAFASLTEVLAQVPAHDADGRNLGSTMGG